MSDFTGPCVDVYSYVHYRYSGQWWSKSPRKVRPKHVSAIKFVTFVTYATVIFPIVYVARYVAKLVDPNKPARFSPRQKEFADRKKKIAQHQKICVALPKIYVCAIFCDHQQFLFWPSVIPFWPSAHSFWPSAIPFWPSAISFWPSAIFYWSSSTWKSCWPMRHFASPQLRMETVFTARYCVVFYFFTILCAWLDLPAKQLFLVWVVRKCYDRSVILPDLPAWYNFCVKARWLNQICRTSQVCSFVLDTCNTNILATVAAMDCTCSKKTDIETFILKVY